MQEQSDDPTCERGSRSDSSLYLAACGGVQSPREGARSGSQVHGTGGRESRAGIKTSSQEVWHRGREDKSQNVTSILTTGTLTFLSCEDDCFACSDLRKS